MRALLENAVQKNWRPEDGERRASERQIRGAESTLTGREIAKPIPLAIVPSAEIIPLAAGRWYRGFPVLGIGRFPTAAGRVEVATIGCASAGRNGKVIRSNSRHEVG
jgi:hypothetical protein